MNVTRDVVTDLLPVYFSGEASADTLTLVEDFFKRDPEFERIARGAVKPLEALRAAVPAPLEAEREKRDLERARREVQRRKWLFGIALFLTLAPFSFFVSGGHIAWNMLRNNPGDAVVYWSAAALYWVLYFARFQRHTAALLCALYFTLFPSYFALRLVFPGAQPAEKNLVELVAFVAAAAVCWFSYFRERPRERS